MELPIPPLLFPRNFSGIETLEVAITEGQQPLTYQLPPEILYHYTSFETAQKIISGHSLKFSAPCTFNDPFDMYEELIDFRATSQQKKAWLNRLLKERTKSDRKRIKRLAQSDEHFENAQRKSFIKMKEEAGVCCFSQHSNVQLMWSHYADKHQGVCLGFDFTPVVYRNDYSLFFHKVNYPDSINKINYHSFRDNAVNQWLSTKSKVWAYEKEYRAFIHNRKGKFFFGFEKACLKEIYFGCRVPKEQIDQMIDFLDQHRYNIVLKNKMIIDDTIFDLKAIML